MSKSKVSKRAQSALSIGLPPKQSVNEAKQLPLLEEQLNRLTGAAENVETQAQRLHELADRLFGLEGVEGKGGEPIPSPLSSVGKLNDAHERLGRARVSLAAAVSRLEAL